jgi:hypothetical protein
MERSIQEFAPFLLTEWTYSTAVANLSVGNYQRATELWGEQADRLTMTQLQALLGLSPAPGQIPARSMLPMIHAPSDARDVKPIMRSRMYGDVILSYAPRWSDTQLQNALALFQQGRIEEARQSLVSVLEYEPETELRPLIAFYLAVVTGEPQAFTPPSDAIPITADMFAPDEAPPEDDGRSLDSTPGTPTTEAATRVGSSVLLPPAPPAARRADRPD